MEKDNPSKSTAESANDYFDKGKELYDRKDYAHAIANFKKAIRLDPNNAEAYRYRGNAKFFLKQYFAAISDYDETNSFRPKKRESLL